MNSRTRKFFSYYKPYRALLFSVLGCACLDAVISLLIPMGVRHITKDILEAGVTGALPMIYQTGVWMLALTLLQMLCGWYYDAKGHTMGAEMERDIRGELFEHLQKLPFSFYDDQKTGQLMSRLTHDPLDLVELYHHGPENLVIYSIKFIGALAVLSATNLRLSLIVFAFLPVMAFYGLHFNKSLKSAYKRNRERIADVNVQAEDSLSGIRVTQSFANEAVETERFRRTNTSFFQSRRGIYHAEAYFYTGMETFSKLITICVAVFGGALIIGGSLGLADLITFLLYVGYLIDPIPRLSFMVQQYQEGIAGFNRVCDIMELTPAIQDAKDAVALPSIRGEVAFDRVGFRYKENLAWVLKDVTLTVQPGETVALVGYSGVGKTTLCSLVPRFYEATEGSVCVDGVDVRNLPLHSLRGAIGVVAQDVYLFAGTVKENMLYGKPGATMEELIAAAQRANAHAFISALPSGYDTDIGQRGVKLSGGQKQRLSIARVFLKNPPILILDEATSALDTESERVVQESLSALAENRTTIIIAHRLSTIRKADRIIVLSEEGIAEQGTHAELLAKGGVYAGLHEKAV